MVFFRVVFLLVAWASSACAASSYPFPKSFAWGTAIAAHQVEGGNLYNDWYTWEKMGKVKGGQIGLAANYYQLYARDHQLAAAMKTNALRLSIEWSRIEPRKDEWDMEAVAHYRAILKDMRAKGITPYVTLLHYTLPAWLVNFSTPDAGHFLVKETVAQFVEFSAFVARNFGDLVDVYFTLNEPNFVALNGCVTGTWPPGSKASAQEMTRFFARALGNASVKDLVASGPALQRLVRMFYLQILAHVGAYDAVKANDAIDADGDGKNAEVGIVYNVVPLAIGKTRPNPSLSAFFSAFNEDMLDTLHTGKIRLFGNSGLSKAELAIPARALAGRVDVLGLNYYTSLSVEDVIPMMLNQVFKIPSGKRRGKYSDFMGLPVRPEALLPLLQRLHGRYHWPLIISENGIATTDETLRATFLIDHLKAVSTAIGAGIPIRGYFLWSLIDTMEWHEGFGYHFGLIGVNFKTLDRTMRSTGLLYKAIIEAGEIPDYLHPKSFSNQALPGL